NAPPEVGAAAARYAAAATFDITRGNVTENVEPAPRTLSTAIEPPRDCVKREADAVVASCIRTVRLREALEDAVPILGADADPGVADGDHDHVLTDDQARAHEPALGELERVVHQVLHDDRALPRVGDDGRGRTGIPFERDAGTSRQPGAR